MKKETYPLEQIAQIKKRRLDEAERILKQKREALTKEEETLKEKKKAFEASKKLKEEIIEKHFKKIEEGTTSDVLERHDTYIKEVITPKISEEKKGVEDQKKVVQEAKKALEEARIIRLKKNQELEKIILHKKDWEKGVRKELSLEEASVSDELGTAMHSRKMRGK